MIPGCRLDVEDIAVNSNVVEDSDDHKVTYVTHF